MPAQNIENIDIHQFLKIVQQSGLNKNLPMASKMWDDFKHLTVGNAKGRKVNYLMTDEAGYAAVQNLPADGSGLLPKSQRGNVDEASAFFKETAWTVNVPHVLMNKTGGDLYEYAGPLAIELDRKRMAHARLKSIELQGDGSGSIGVITTRDAAGNNAVFGIDDTDANSARSWIRWFQRGDRLKVAAPDSTLRTQVNTSDNIAYFKVADVDDEAREVTLEAFNASDVKVNVTGFASASSPAVGDHFYRQREHIPDLSGPITADYQTLSNSMVGLPGFSLQEGLLMGIQKQGEYKGTQIDCGGGLIDSSFFQRGLTTVKRRRSGHNYQWSKAYMADETYDAMFDVWQPDRRFNSASDGDLGVNGLYFVHGDTKVEFCPDEFVHARSIWVPPVGSEALAFIKDEPREIAPNGSDKFHLRPATIDGETGYARETEAYYEQSYVFVPKDAAALLHIKNFVTV